MSSGVIGSLAVSLVARVQKFKKDMRSAGTSVTNMATTARQAGAGMSAITPALTRMAGRGGYAGVALAASYAASKVITLSDAQAKSIDLIGKTSDKLGLNAERLQQLQYAGEMTGVATNTMNMALQRMTRRVAEAAQGTGEAKGALAELNLSAEALATLSPDKQFAAIANAFSSIGSQSEKVRLAFKIFDSEGVGLVNTMAGGVEGLNKALAESRGTGSIVSEEQVKQVEALNDATSRLGKSWTGLIQPTTLWFSAWKTGRANAIAKEIEGWSNWFNGVDKSTKDVIISQQELNKVFDAQAAIREKQAAAEAKRKEQRQKEFEELEKTIAAEKESLEMEIRRTQLNSATLGMSPEQRRIAELRREFADNAINSETADALIEELKTAEKLRKEHERIEEVKRQNVAASEAAARQQADEADALRESLKSEKTKLVDEVARIQQLRDAGNIGAGTQRQAIEKMLKGLIPESGRLTGAMTEGSREARSLILGSRYERPEDAVAKNTGEMRELLQGILDNLEAGEMIPAAAGEAKQWQ